MKAGKKLLAVAGLASALVCASNLRVCGRRGWHQQNLAGHERVHSDARRIYHHFARACQIRLADV